MSYVEAHGTGTSLGDPIEVHALGAVYGSGRDPGPPLAGGLGQNQFWPPRSRRRPGGAVKNRAGAARRPIPAHLHFTSPNPFIAWADFAVAVPVTTQAWQPIAGRRIAGVSSFGFSGTNAHLIIEEAPRPPPAAPAASPGRLRLIPFRPKAPPPCAHWPKAMKTSWRASR